MTAVAHTPAVLSALLLGAHFLRGGHLVLVVAAAALLALLSVRRPWAARVAQGALLLGVFEWTRTLVALVHARKAADLPYLRMAAILGAVVALGVVAAWSFETATLRARYGRSA